MTKVRLTKTMTWKQVVLKLMQKLGAKNGIHYLRIAIEAAGYAYRNKKAKFLSQTVAVMLRQLRLEGKVARVKPGVYKLV